jgi:hypothetical protein
VACCGAVGTNYAHVDSATQTKCASLMAHAEVACRAMLCCAVLCRLQAEEVYRQQMQRDVDRVAATKQQEESK